MKMFINKNKYYINVSSGEVSLIPLDVSHFEIEATEEEVSKLKRIFGDIHSANLGTYIRSHIPFVEYSKDSANDRYDDGFRKVYKMIYQLRDNTTKRHIESMGILDSRDKEYL
jgi:hypothetical protein